jgi:UDPglucose 6-dehydrogenase
MRITIAGYGAIGHYIESVFSAGNQIAVYDPPQGLGTHSDLVDTDFVFVCVPTQPREDGSCDTSIVEEVVRLADPRVAIVCESTIAVGTTERLIRETGKPMVFVPEYAGEEATHPFRDVGARRFFIYGGYEPAASQVRDLFARTYSLDANHLIVPPTQAEMAKYMENSFLAMKVAFCNEFFDLCQAFGLDYDAVRALWLQDWRIGESHTTVTAERGYGGKCLPKDVAAICSTGREAGIPMEIMVAVQHANLRHRSAGEAMPADSVSCAAQPEPAGRR